jgi:hypothetical protein
MCRPPTDVPGSGHVVVAPGDVERSAAVNQFDPRQLVGAQLVGPGEKRIGTIGQVLLDDRTGAPQWVTVRMGPVGRRTRMVPLSAARLAPNGDIEVPYLKDQVKDAPSVTVNDGHISEAEEASLYRYYGSEQAGVDRDAGETSSGPRHLARTGPGPVGDAERRRAGRRSRLREREGEEHPSRTDDLRGRHE